MKGKIVILGAGHVGSHVARALAAGNIGGEIVLMLCTLLAYRRTQKSL